MVLPGKKFFFVKVLVALIQNNFSRSFHGSCIIATSRLLRIKGHRKEEMKTYEIEGQKEAERKLYNSNDY